MYSNSMLKNSSLFIAYMGCLGWDSAYFYGWGVSFYYGFPWWVVSTGIDDVARSLFHAVTIMITLLFSWGIGVLFFLGVKNKINMYELSSFRLFLAVFLLFIPIVIEFSVLKKHLALKLLLLSLVVSVIITVIIRMYGHRVSASCFSQSAFIKKHLIEICFVSFVIYFWVFSFSVGFYKPQFKKEYEMINHNDGWYYILARYDASLVLSKSFKSGNGRFLVIRTEQLKNYEFNMVRTDL